MLLMLLLVILMLLMVHRLSVVTGANVVDIVFANDVIDTTVDVVTVVDAYRSDKFHPLFIGIYTVLVGSRGR